MVITATVAQVAGLTPQNDSDYATSTYHHRPGVGASGLIGLKRILPAL